MMDAEKLPANSPLGRPIVPQPDKNAYRRFLAEQRLLSFVYYADADRCELIDAQTNATMDLSERVPATLLSALMEVLRGAAEAGKSFIHRQEVGGRLYTCFGFVNRADGKTVTLEGFLVPERGFDTETNHLFGRRREDRDSFTGLYTKMAIKTYARNLLESDSHAPVVFCMVDLDYFKDVNDTYGHDFGDTVIMKTADILSAAVEGLGVVGRFGGDEFFIVLHKPLSEVELRSFLLGFRTELAHAFADTPQHLTLHCSVGVACRPANGTSFEVLFAKADRALYIAKQKGRNRYIIYREALHGELHDADDAGEKTLRAALRLDDSLQETENCIDMVYREGQAALPAILQKIRLAYAYDGVALFAGEGLHLQCENGAACGLADFSIINAPAVAAILDETGMYRVNLQQLHSEYLTDFHGLLEKCALTSILLYRIGSKTAPRGVLLLHSHWKDNTQGHMPSDEQQHVLGMLAYAIGKTVLA